MELSTPQIALLVLGFLKNERCYNSYNTFLESCKYFESNKHMIKSGKFSTRVAGMSLIDYFKDYSQIYHIIQVHLEETNYFQEERPKRSLVDQLIYLLDNSQEHGQEELGREHDSIKNSTPLSSNEIETTPVESLPGNSQLDDIEDKSSQTHKTTPKKKQFKNEVLDVSEVLAQTLLDSTELHVRLAETINTVRNTTPEVGERAINEEVSAGASKELEALIKTVVEKTEGDPVYNKLIDEIIGSTCDSATSCNKSPSLAPDDNIKVKPQENPMEVENNDAVRSIIAASDLDTPLLPDLTNHRQVVTSSTEVYVYDGTLDSFLKNSGGTGTPPVQNPVFISAGGLFFVAPPPQPPPVPPTVKEALSENDILAMPTVIVNEPTPNKVEESQKSKKTPKQRLTRSTQVKNEVKVTTPPPTTADDTQKVPTPRHVRNLNFSTPSKGAVSAVPRRRAWDADLRGLANVESGTRPPPSKKKAPVKKAKKVAPKTVEIQKPVIDEKVERDSSECWLATPMKEGPPKTPVPEKNSTTPFTQMLEDHLRDVDLMSLPTPNLPITPGFSLTPMMGPLNRPTDYSTSSSYYQPSDNEQNKSIEQLIEESKKTHTKVTVLSDIVVKPGTINTFNHNMVAKKNLNLIEDSSSSSSDDTSDSPSDSDKSDEGTGNTVIQVETHEEVEIIPSSRLGDEKSIKEIIGSVEIKDNFSSVKKPRDMDAAEVARMKRDLDAIRKRTIQRIRTITPKRKQTKVKAPPPRARIPRATKSKMIDKPQEPVVVTTADDKSNELVEGLKARGIHVFPNKSPAKMEQGLKEFEESEPPLTPSSVTFDRVTITDEIHVRHDPKAKPKAVIEYDLYRLEKGWSASVYVEHLDSEVNRTLRCTPFDVFIDFVPKINVLTPRRCKRLANSAIENNETKDVEEIIITDDCGTVDGENDHLMDFVFVGCDGENAGQVPIKGNCKKRKTRASECEEEQHVEKKTKNNGLKILKKINVEEFLDKLHGGC